jgi:hypothetical protein
VERSGDVLAPVSLRDCIRFRERPVATARPERGTRQTDDQADDQTDDQTDDETEERS